MDRTNGRYTSTSLLKKRQRPSEIVEHLHLCICSQYFRLHSRKRKPCLIIINTYFGVLLHPPTHDFTFRTTGLLMLHHSATLFVPFQTVITNLPAVVQFIFIFYWENRSLRVLEAICCFLLLWFSFHPCPALIKCCHCTLCWNLPKDRNKNREQKGDFLTRRATTQWGYMAVIRGTNDTCSDQIQTFCLERIKYVEELKPFALCITKNTSFTPRYISNTWNDSFVTTVPVFVFDCSNKLKMFLSY